ncbi:hypothetical protein CRUP_033906, partial [Coryphaenoides rupestris]
YLTWKVPEDNGGAVISHYIVEKKDVASAHWVPVSASNKKPSLMAMYLMEGIQYLFRVAAENQFGRSDFVVTKTPIKAIDPLYPPGPPKNLHHTDADKTEVWLEWEWPDRTGGSDITGFIVEHQEDGQTDWVTFKTVDNNRSHVTGLVEGKTYRFRVKAQNKIGVSRPDTMPPTIDVDVKLIEGLVVKAGTTIVLPAKMTGIPTPTAKWMSDGKEIMSEGHYSIESTGSSSVLSIPESVRGDTGEYLITVSNPAGSKTAALHVTVLDVPSAPIGPVNILEVTPDFMMIQWRAPKDDGGTPVTNYVVEKKDVKKPWEPWSVVSSSGTSTKAKVSRLEKGREYIIRIRAENKIGIGAGLESPPTIAKHMFNPPSSPGPPECSDITENAVTLEWALPENDGGSPISGYVIERREMTGKWIRVNKTPVLDLRYRVSGLFEGNSYEFRVFAENIGGISGPSPISDPMKATRALTKPGPPGSPKLKDWSKSYADICWIKPTRDGGSPILGYVVEAQKSGSAQWDKINKDIIKICAYRVPGLMEGMEYRFRIRATNKIGDSEPRELTETVLAKDILVPPEVVVDVSCRDSLSVRAGQIISLITRVKGRPDPEITWTKDARAIGRDKRTEVNNNYPLCELVISDAVRADYGKYAISAKNSSGQAQATIIVNVLDVPGPCQNLKVAYVTRSSCMVSWENPEDYGGTEITQYRVECRQPSQRGWTILSSDLTKRQMKAPLTEGCEYFFRVSAENKIGSGPSIESKTAVLAVDPIEKPGEPIDFHIAEIGKTFCFIKWKKPDYDGGSRAIGYHVEKKPKEAEDWERLHKGAIKETYFMADRCVENQVYQFRVQTKNEGGESNWVTTDDVLVKEQLVEPEIKIKLDSNLVLKAGDSIAIEATIKGKPQCDVKWTKDDSTKEIRKGLRHKLESGADFSKLLVTGARRTDSGKYVITASNIAGTCSADAKVIVLDRPGPISDLKVSGITTDRCHLTWEVPEDDGGCEIYNYIIEKCETKRGVWSVHSNAVITNKANVTRLIEGNEYIFRVRAENKMGPGPAVQSEAIVAGTQFNVPGAPDTPEITKIAKEEMSVEWSEPDRDGGKPITGYLLEKKEEHAVRWSPVNKDAIPGNRLTVTGLLPLHEYQYRVKAVNEIGVGAASKPSRAITAKDAIEPPAPPTNMKVLDSTKSTISLGWTKPVSDGGVPLIGYVVEIRVKGMAKKDEGWKRCNVAAQL